MVTYTIPNVPQSITMQEFFAYSNKFGGLGKSCRFLAKIQPVGGLLVALNRNALVNDLMYLCESTEFPGRTMNNIEVRYYGPSFKLPVNTSAYDDLTMTFMTRAESHEREFFDNWMNIINPIQTYDFQYRDDYRADITIWNISDIQGKGASYAFTLKNAFPIMVSPQPVTWADDQFLRLGVSFTYQYWHRPGSGDLV